MALTMRSAERERKRLHTWIQKLDLELSVHDGLGLSNGLVQTLFRHGTVSLVVYGNAVSGAWWPSVKEHAKSHRYTLPRRSHHEMQVARMKPIHHASVRLLQHRGLSPNG